MKSQLADFLSLIYPRICIHCSEALTKKEEHLCLSCELSLPKSQYLTNKHELLKKFSFQPKVVGAYAYLDYIKDGIVQKLIHSMKYHGKKELGIWLGSKYGSQLVNQLDIPIDCIVPLPIHDKRKKQRGYNQSELIANGLGNVLKLTVDCNMVERAKETTTQTKKSKIGRWENMDSVFKVSDGAKIEGRNVLVVDDVVTSGATLGMLCDEIAKKDPESITIAALVAAK